MVANVQENVSNSQNVNISSDIQKAGFQAGFLFYDKIMLCLKFKVLKMI